MSNYKIVQDVAQGGMQQALDYWWSLRSGDLHTQLPAKVMFVDYIKNSVTVQPLISTYIYGDKTIQFPQMFEVPVGLLSSGSASITIPLVVGSLGVLFFSERDITNWLNSTGGEIVSPSIKDPLSMGAKLYPLKFEIGLFTPSSAIQWDSENIVIKHGSNTIKIPLKSTSPILINGAQVTPDGNIITKSGTDLDKLNQDFQAHVHSGVTIGGSNSGGIIVPPTV